MTQGGLPRGHALLLTVVALAAAAATVFAAWAASQSTVLQNPGLQEAWRPAFVATYAAAGVYLWERRPRSLTGPRIAGLGLLYGLTSLNAFSNPWLFCAGRVAVALFVCGMAYVFLAYPRDRMARRDRLPVAALTVALVAVWSLTLLCSPTLPPSGALSACRKPCPANPALVVHSATAGDIGRYGVTIVTALLLALTVVGLIRKLRSRGPFGRYLFGPPLVAAAGLAIAYATYTLLASRGASTLWPIGLATVLFGIAVPIGLVGGQLWAVSSATGRLRRLAVDLPPSQVTQERLEETLRGTLDDRTLRLWRWDRSRRAFVDAAGEQLDLREVPEGGETIVEPEGRSAGALTHDPSLQDVAPVPEALAGTAVALLDEASLREELRGARQRLAATSHAERVRLERDLHDGIQPRLTSLGVKLAEARAMAPSDDLDALLADAQRDVADLVDGVRSLAHQLYPPALHEEGLVTALQASMQRTGVTVTDRGIGRLTPAAEEALYYATLEAVQNALKHAGDGSSVSILLERIETEAVVQITDDGGGFEVSAMHAGLGTANMRDRAGAVGGTVEIDSHPGDGTTITVRVPTVGPGADGSARQRTVGRLLEVAERHRAAATLHARAAEFWDARGDAARAADERASGAAALSRARRARSSARVLASGVSPSVDGDGSAPVL